ncbi:alpha/beta-hydrolase [Thozetella sp. PMI_491]|nr:alpha/beta-hydrolase [Thozetella sp. PMI_491]
MDAVLAKIAQETIKFGPGDEEVWRELYEPLYPEFRRDIQVLRDQRYGPADRNLLDVYVPPGETHDKPVLLYIHGGGFFSGDKRWSEKCYANIGYAFASQGIATVVANHQLVPNVTYPGGADDMQLAREWIYNNISDAKCGYGSTSKVILFGHSSGGAHIAANLFAAGDPERAKKDPLFPPVAGLILLDVPFWYDRRKPVRQKTIRSYYGDDAEEAWGPKSAVGLWERLPDDSPLLDSRKLPIYLGSVEWEVPETTDATIKFFNAYRARSLPTGTLPFFHVLPKHNHLSNVLSIGTSDTAQRDLILQFIAACLR